jgi:hypothetical protein
VALAAAIYKGTFHPEKELYLPISSQPEQLATRYTNMASSCNIFSAVPSHQWVPYDPSARKPKSKSKAKAKAKKIAERDLVSTIFKARFKYLPLNRFGGIWFIRNYRFYWFARYYLTIRGYQPMEFS